MGFYGAAGQAAARSIALSGGNGCMPADARGMLEVDGAARSLRSFLFMMPNC